MTPTPMVPKPIIPTWLIAIGVVFLLQTASSFITRLVPIASPAFMAEFGWDRSWIGYLTAANVVGALFVLFACIGLIKRMGGVLALQASLLLGAACLILYMVPSITVALLASVLIGLGMGAANPVGSDVLQRFTPRAHRNFVFSIKQSGVPLGGVIAGLSIPPLVEWLGWRSALAVAAVAAGVAILVLLPLRARIDGPRERVETASRPGFSLRDVAGPLLALTRGPGLMRMALVGSLLAIAQACWFAFTVTYLVVALGWSLSVAGLVFAVMQAGSTLGRIVIGWIADNVASSTVTLSIAAIASAVSTAALGLSGPGWPLWSMIALAAVAGASVSGWNGVQIAEVARRAPPPLVADAAAGSVILVFLSNMLAPVAFAAFVAASNRYDIAFVAAGACSLICLPLLYGIDRQDVKTVS